MCVSAKTTKYMLFGYWSLVDGAALCECVCVLSFLLAQSRSFTHSLHIVFMKIYVLNAMRIAAIVLTIVFRMIARLEQNG